jgi:AcrR family transcriptional regulator
MKSDVSSESVHPADLPEGPSIRQRILDSAFELFYREGIHTVGVDAVVAASGVAKMSLYRHFASKDDLIRAVLEEHDRRYWIWWDRVMADHAGDPRAQLRALCKTIAGRLVRPTFRGCAFINFVAEFATPGHPGYPVVLANKKEQRSRLTALAAEVGAVRPEAFADQLMLLIEGARVSRQTMGAEGPALSLVQAADALLFAHTGSPAA